MLIGIDHFTIAHRGLSADEVLDLVKECELDGIQLREPSAIDSELNPGRLEQFRQRAESLGLFLEVGIPSPNPLRCAMLENRPVEPIELARRLTPHLEAIATLGCRHARAFIGDRHDRFRQNAPWKEQLAATGRVLKHLRPLLKSMGIRIALETHADATAVELERVVLDAGTDIAGIILDTGNLVLRLDDPLESVERLANLVLGVHAKDAVLAFGERGLIWQPRPVGSGILPIPEMLARVGRSNPGANVSIELHSRTYELPLFERAWLAHFPEVDPYALMSIVHLTHRCEQRYQDGSLERPEAIEILPWAQLDLDWLARSAGFLRPVTQLLGSL